MSVADDSVDRDAESLLEAADRRVGLGSEDPVHLVPNWALASCRGGSSELVTILGRMSSEELIMTNDADLQPAIAAEFLALADLLDSATDVQWDTPSLCAGWRVREVIAHMTMAARYSEEEFMAEVRRCDFDFSRLSNEIAARDAELPASELVASLRSEVMQHWTPPGGGWHGAITD